MSTAVEFAKQSDGPRERVICSNLFVSPKGCHILLRDVFLTTFNYATLCELSRVAMNRTLNLRYLIFASRIIIFPKGTHGKIIRLKIKIRDIIA